MPDAIDIHTANSHSQGEKNPFDRHRDNADSASLIPNHELDRMHRIVGIVSRLSFGVASLALILLAYVLLFYGVRDLYLFLMHPTPHDDIKNIILRTVSYVVVAIAVFDVSKFFIEDEVIKDSDKLSEWQIRNSLSKFITTVIIAVFVEGLVGIFEEGIGGGVKILYPAALLVVGSLIVFIMGVYQKMTRNVLLSERKRINLQRLQAAKEQQEKQEKSTEQLKKNP